MKPPKYVDCHNCGARTRPKWVKKFDLPEGIKLLGFGTCPKCNAAALHIKGDPETASAVAVDFEEHVKLGEGDMRPTSIVTGKLWLDG
jgi:hypothetical protein